MADKETAKALAPGARIYCARAHNKWGLGFSVYQALDAARPNDGNVFSVVMLPAHARMPYVDQLGCLHWTGPIEHATKKGSYKAIASDDSHYDDFDYEPVEDEE